MNYANNLQRYVVLHSREGHTVQQTTFAVWAGSAQAAIMLTLRFIDRERLDYRQGFFMARVDGAAPADFYLN